MSYGRYSGGQGGNSYRSGYGRQRQRRGYDNYGHQGYYDQSYGPQPLPSYGQQRQKKKQNGCKVFTGKNGVEYISGWCNDKYKGFIKVLVYRVEKSDVVHTSQSGRDWCSVRAKVTFANGQTQVFNALLDVNANRVKIKDLGFVLSPNKNYCGPVFTKK